MLAFSLIRITNYEQLIDHPEVPATQATLVLDLLVTLIKFGIVNNIKFLFNLVKVHFLHLGLHYSLPTETIN